MLTSHAVPNDTLNLAFTLSRGVPRAGAFEPRAHSTSPLHEAQRGTAGLKVVRGQADAFITAPLLCEASRGGTPFASERVSKAADEERNPRDAGASQFNSANSWIVR